MGLNEKRFRPNWSELNQELLEVIVSKLSCVDVQCFKWVCSSWHAAAERLKSGPLLVLPSTREGQETIQLGVFSVKDKTTSDLKLILEKSKDIIMEPEEIRFVGSSHGWMVMVDRDAEPYICNLFSRTCVQLPGKSTIQELVSSWPKFDCDLQRTLIQKAILTANPSHSKNYKVVIIHNSCQKLAFCGKNDKRWTGFSESQGYSDLVWSDKMLYALRDGVTFEGWEFSNGSSCPTRKMCIRCSFSPNFCLPSDICTTQWYIVPSMREILFIVRYIGEFVNGRGDLLSEGELLDGQDCWYRTFKFEVFRLDMIAQKLVQVKSLKDEVIFVGGNHGISLAAKDYQGFKANSIYFTDDYWDRMYEDYSYGGHDFGMFSLEDESIGSVYEWDFVGRFEPIPFWILPN